MHRCLSMRRGCPGEDTTFVQTTTYNDLRQIVFWICLCQLPSRVPTHTSPPHATICRVPCAVCFQTELNFRTEVIVAVAGNRQEGAGQLGGAAAEPRQRDRGSQRPVREAAWAVRRAGKCSIFVSGLQFPPTVELLKEGTIYSYTFQSSILRSNGE